MLRDTGLEPSLSYYFSPNYSGNLILIMPNPGLAQVSLLYNFFQNG